METKKLFKLNHLIHGAYECFSFQEFLKLAILQLHELISYDSGMFFCAISKDCSFFKPFGGGGLESCYQKQPFPQREDYLKQKEEEAAGTEALVYRALDYSQGVIAVERDPRDSFLVSQEDYFVACIRIVYQGQFLGEIYLHRSREQPDFDQEDMLILRLLQPHISTVFHIIHTVTAVSFLEAGDGCLSRKGLCLLDRDLSLAGSNVAGLEMLRVQTVFGSSVLYHVKELCGDMRSKAKSGSQLLWESGAWKTKDGTLLADLVFLRSGGGRKDGQYLLSMEFKDGATDSADYQFKFTKREADIIDGIIQGKNNAQLAALLHLSENTIKTHIRNIYRKSGANNRTELTYILMTTPKSVG